jgi:hypothetical protein
MLRAIASITPKDIVVSDFIRGVDTRTRLELVIE